MFRYMLSPIDYFGGCVDLWQYIEQLRTEQEEYGQMMTKYECESQVNSVLTKLSCEMAKLVKAGWEGDVRGRIFVFAVPGTEVNTEIGFLFKQDNNGTTFVMSPVELPHLQEFVVG